MPPGRLSRIDAHPQREAIVKAILDGESHLSIARRFAVNPRSVRTFSDRHLNRAALAAKHELRDGKSIVSKLEYVVSLLTKQANALDEYLRDPDDPSKYTMDPFASEVEVVYTDTIDDPTDPKGERTVKIKRRGSLQQLLDIVKGSNKIAYDFNLTIKRDDSRRINVMTLHEINEAIGQITKLWALIAEAKQNVTRSEVFALFMQAIVRATKDHPDMLQAIAAEFETEGKASEAAPR